MHLRLDQAAPQSLTRAHRFIAHFAARMTCLPDLDVLARWDDGVGLSLGDGRVARFGIVGTVATDAANGLVGWYLAEQLWQHGGITYAVVSDLDGPNFKRARINAQMHLAPLAPVFGPVFLAFPLAFTRELDAGAVDQQIQCGGTWAIG